MDCLSNVYLCWTTSPVCSDEGLTLGTPAIHQTTQAEKHTILRALLMKPIFSLFANADKTVFLKTCLSTVSSIGPVSTTIIPETCKFTTDNRPARHFSRWIKMLVWGGQSVSVRDFCGNDKIKFLKALKSLTLEQPATA